MLLAESHFTRSQEYVCTFFFFAAQQQIQLTSQQLQMIRTQMTGT